MELVNYFDTLDQLAQKDKTLLELHLMPIKLKKGDYFLKTGHLCNRIGFINEGIMRSFFYDEKGNEFSHCFITKNGFVTDPIAFNNQSLSTQNIIAETDVDLTFFTFDAYRVFEKEISSWQSIVKKVTDNSLTTKVLEKGYMLSEDATTRYLKFSNEHPYILQNVPLKSIASFLGITKYSISRIRKSISKR